jgi:hypothetical protein
MADPPDGGPDPARLTLRAIRHHDSFVINGLVRPQANLVLGGVRLPGQADSPGRPAPGYGDGPGPANGARAVPWWPVLAASS